MGRVRNYEKLMSFKVVALLVLAAIGGFAVAYTHRPGAAAAVTLAALAVFLSASGAELLNKLMERDIDSKMSRTMNRPSVKGGVDITFGYALGLALAALGIGVGYVVNQLTALMVFLGVFFYLIVYTEVLKRRSALNIVIGGLAGSFCVWAGVAAAANTVTVPGFLLGLLVLLWIPGHIWSFAIKYRKDYNKVGVPMFTAVASLKRGTNTIAVFNILMALLSVYLVRYMGLYYAAVIAIPLVISLYLSFRTVADSKAAWSLFKFSSIYLTFVFIAVIVAALA